MTWPGGDCQGQRVKADPARRGGKDEQDADLLEADVEPRGFRVQGYKASQNWGCGSLGCV